MRKFWVDFKKFILRGNVLDLAVAVIIGAAFNTLVQSLVRNIMTPLIGALFGKPNFTDLQFTLGSCSTTSAGAKSCAGTVTYGSFLTDLVNFIVIGFSVYVIVKTFEGLQNLRKTSPPEEQPDLTVDQELLTEIRDLLAARTDS
jgi:large conductance mechanosensitive channel